MNFYTRSEVARMFVLAGFQVEGMTDEMVIEAVKDTESGIAQSVCDQIAHWTTADLAHLAGPAPARVPAEHRASKLAARVRQGLLRTPPK